MIRVEEEESCRVVTSNLQLFDFGLKNEEDHEVEKRNKDRESNKERKDNTKITPVLDLALQSNSMIDKDANIASQGGNN